MKITVMNLAKETLTMYADNRKVHVEKTNNYDVDFMINVGDDFMESNLSIVYDGDLSFEKAEEIILDKLVKIK